MLGPPVFVETLSRVTRTYQFGNKWQYHSRSDHHSKVACALVLFDLLANCRLFAAHAAAGKIAFGINHEMRDFSQNRKKKLDLVVCTPATGQAAELQTLLQQADAWKLAFSEAQRETVLRLPSIVRAPVGHVLIALEAKACMTAHRKALPRLYDELNSSHLTVHGAAEAAIAAGFVCINAAPRYCSPDLNKRLLRGDATWSTNAQPRSAEITVAKIKEVPRRSGASGQGFDAMAIVVIDCRNDGSEIRLVKDAPAPAQGDIFSYESGSAGPTRRAFAICRRETQQPRGQQGFVFRLAFPHHDDT